MNNLASLLKSQGKYEEAEPVYRQTLALREKALGKEHIMPTINDILEDIKTAQALLLEAVKKV